MQIVKIITTNDELVDLMIAEYIAFMAHTARVRQQYTVMVKLKKKLPKRDVIVQMDFAENLLMKSKTPIGTVRVLHYIQWLYITMTLTVS